MHDIRRIRDDPAGFDRDMGRRGLEPQSARLIAIDERRRSVQTELQRLQARRNEASREVGLARRAGGDAAELMAEVGRLKDRMAELEAEEREAAASLEAAVAVLPNAPLADVPDGPDE